MSNKQENTENNPIPQDLPEADFSEMENLGNSGGGKKDGDGNGKKPDFVIVAIGGSKIKLTVGDYFRHIESHRLNQITGFTNVILTNPENGEKIKTITVSYISAQNFKSFDLNILKFLQTFTPTFSPVHSQKQMKGVEKALKAGEDPSKALLEGDNTLDGETDILGDLYTPNGNCKFENIVIYPNVEEELKIGVDSILNGPEIQKEWGLESLFESGNRCVINMYGKPGTGKTLSARCIANYLNKKLLQVDYSQIVDKYVGETGKHIAKVFENAKKLDAILFLDEADSLLSKRVDMTTNSDYANSVNSNRNVFMQELDKFEGVVLMSTNFFKNFDDAFVRRINRNIKFNLPNSEMREKLYKLHIPNSSRAKDVDFKLIAKESIEFSGGDIKNVCKNAIEKASRDKDKTKWILNNQLMLESVKSIKTAKEEHAKKKGWSGKVIGFGAPDNQDKIEILE